MDLVDALKALAFARKALSVPDGELANMADDMPFLKSKGADRRVEIALGAVEIAGNTLAAFMALADVVESSVKAKAEPDRPFGFAASRKGDC